MTDWATVPFRKSTRSSTNGGQCVEVGSRPGLIAVRDSKSPASGLIVFPTSAWTKALASLK
ncbi:DUF397 domain-containing protein [Actinokineospora cianjurensis]|uniref:Uncharacterized protein DUF397 n=1 Tax=Actinokineospora cianjurensis TaxID=585224 RepID=A0A421BAW3_9PSEU|nr:DUF397 domain-containing protein [Actinokineospora cianjurensis]RLK61455.1 uncharacterized protein DUF397 [Actinokineospora cianjurensis]